VSRGAVLASAIRAKEQLAPTADFERDALQADGDRMRVIGVRA
jgi:hypothetical protein